MNTKLHLFALIIALAASAAQAVHIPGWERPVYRANLVELDDQNGNVIESHLKKSLTMHKQQGAASATSLTFREEEQVYCITAPCPPITHTTVYRIVGKPEVDGCGTTHYTAYETSPADLMDDRPQVNPPRRLLLADHTTRKCKDLRRYRWELQIDGHREDARFFGGNPSALLTIQ